MAFQGWRHEDCEFGGRVRAAFVGAGVGLDSLCYPDVHFWVFGGW
jgi:hypothetical protein